MPMTIVIPKPMIGAQEALPAPRGVGVQGRGAAGALRRSAQANSVASRSPNACGQRQARDEDEDHPERAALARSTRESSPCSAFAAQRCRPGPPDERQHEHRPTEAGPAGDRATARRTPGRSRTRTPGPTAAPPEWSGAGSSGTPGGFDGLLHAASVADAWRERQDSQNKAARGVELAAGGAERLGGGSQSLPIGLPTWLRRLRTVPQRPAVGQRRAVRQLPRAPTAWPPAPPAGP